MFAVFSVVRIAARAAAFIYINKNYEPGPAQGPDGRDSITYGHAPQ
jgi:hypothetical protein